MPEFREFKIVFTGPMGAGKTTAIAAISDSAPVSTDVVNNDRAAFDKEFTTVALDYGQICLEEGLVVHLYGTPGQERFSFMRRLLFSGALGIVLLIDGSRDDARSELEFYLQGMRELSPQPAIVIGIGRCDSSDAPILEFAASLLERFELTLPVFSVDVRRSADVRLLVETLVCVLEASLEAEYAE